MVGYGSMDDAVVVADVGYTKVRWKETERIDYTTLVTESSMKRLGFKLRTILAKCVWIHPEQDSEQCHDTPSLWNRSTRVLNATGLTRLRNPGLMSNGKRQDRN